jgi:hypothetical protein
LTEKKLFPVQVNKYIPSSFRSQLLLSEYQFFIEADTLAS